MNTLLLVVCIHLEDTTRVSVYYVVQKTGNKIFIYSTHQYRAFSQTIFNLFKKLCDVCHKKIYFLYFFNSIITSSRRIQEESINLAKYIMRLCEKSVCLILQQYEAKKENKMVLFGMNQVKHI